MKPINPLLIISGILAASSAQASFQPLLGSDLNNQSLYASGYITMGARTSVNGNIQSAAAITLGANANVGGNVEAGTTVTLGASAGVDGYLQAGTTATIGASSNVDGDIMAGTTVTIGATVEVDGNVTAGTTVTVGAGSIFHKNVDAGTTTTIGAGVQIEGELTAYSMQVGDIPILVNKADLITSVQTTIKALGTGTELVSTAFGTNDEVLEAGIYSSINYLTIAIGKTLTLDGKGIDGSWVFNIANYLSFAANSKVVLENVTHNSSIIWNVLGDKLGATGYTQLGVGAEVRGYIFAKGYVQTGANSLIAGIGNDCGGAYSANNFIQFGADSLVGHTGCTNGVVTAPTEVSEPTSIWLLATGFLGLAVNTRRKKA